MVDDWFISASKQHSFLWKEIINLVSFLDFLPFKLSKQVPKEKKYDCKKRKAIKNL